jgi:hypothetical protein
MFSDEPSSDLFRGTESSIGCEFFAAKFYLEVVIFVICD